MKNYIGMDNGATGTIGIIDADGVAHNYRTPVHKRQDYTKKAKIISRIDWQGLIDLLKPYQRDAVVAIERPAINPVFFNTSINAARSHEATVIVMEIMGLRHRFIDSHEWKKALLPEGYKKDPKTCALEEVRRRFPSIEINSKSKADGLLIAEYMRIKGGEG